MRIYLNKKHLKEVAIAGFFLATILLLLKLIAMWDGAYGKVDFEAVQPTVPPSETQPKAPDISVREPTEEERAALANGSMTKDELMQELVKDTVVLPTEETKEGETNTPPSEAGQTDTGQIEQPVQTDYERRMAEIIAQVYVLRDEYIVMLDNMYTEAETVLLALAKEENSEKAIASLVSGYLSKATELEIQCDNKIDAIVLEMEGLIRENNGDMALVDTLIETYATEKAAKKAWYIKRLEEKGLV